LGLARNGHVVPCVGGDDCKRKQLRRAVGTRDQNGRLAAVLECFEHMRDRQEVALIIDEECVPEKGVVISARRLRLVKAVNDRADCRAQRVVHTIVIRGRGTKQAYRKRNRRR